MTRVLPFGYSWRTNSYGTAHLHRDDLTTPCGQAEFVTDHRPYRAGDRLCQRCAAPNPRCRVCGYAVRLLPDGTAERHHAGSREACPGTRQPTWQVTVTAGADRRPAAIDEPPDLAPPPPPVCSECGRSTVRYLSARWRCPPCRISWHDDGTDGRHEPARPGMGR